MENYTSFSKVYDSFLSKITDDMFMELFLEETLSIQETLLVNALHWFEFPKVDVFNYTLSDSSGSEEPGHFNLELSNEEINIVATYMVVEWLGYQIASVENTRMKFSGADFKFTSQANHLAKLIILRNEYKTEGFHLQRLYKRREKDAATGRMKSTLSRIMEVT